MPAQNTSFLNPVNCYVNHLIYLMGDPSSHIHIMIMTFQAPQQNYKHVNSHYYAFFSIRTMTLRFHNNLLTVSTLITTT